MAWAYLSVCVLDTDISTDVPVDALCSQAGRSEDFLHMTLPVGGFEFTEPAVHAVRLIIACLHQLYQTLLQNIRPVGEQLSDYSRSYRAHLCSCACSLTAWCILITKFKKYFLGLAKSNLPGWLQLAGKQAERLRNVTGFATVCHQIVMKQEIFFLLIHQFKKKHDMNFKNVKNTHPELSKEVI